MWSFTGVQAYIIISLTLKAEKLNSGKLILKKFLQFQNSDLIKLEYASGLNILAPSILKTTLGSLLDFQI